MVYTNINVLRSSDYSGNINKAVEYLLNHKDELINMEVGKYEICPEFFYMIQEYQTKDSAVWEGHLKYMDIQLILEGEEVINIANKEHLTLLKEYDSEKDWIEFKGEARMEMLMTKGDLAIFYPEDIHQPALKTKNGNSTVKKCLFKVLI